MMRRISPRIPAPTHGRSRIAVLAGLTALTIGIHYGWLVEPFFGHVHWIHAIHSRLCYIPIVIAAAWFGLRGGVIQAAVISILVLPYALGQTADQAALLAELVEIVFYFAIAILVGFLVDREDAARRKQQETQLQVERSQKLSLVGQLAAGVAHEIKNPLSSIKGAADILSDDTTKPEERAEFRDILQSEVRRIDATVREFLEFARPRETRLERLKFSDVLRTAVRQLEAQARGQNVRIESAIAPDVYVRGDAEKLHQLALNLLLNAIEASPENAVVYVRLSAADRNVDLEVSDRGHGISPSDLERMFEPFFTTRPSGTGLGLAVGKAIVESHGGQIWIESRPGEGTQVTVRLPHLECEGVA